LQAWSGRGSRPQLGARARRVRGDADVRREHGGAHPDAAARDLLRARIRSPDRAEPVDRAGGRGVRAARRHPRGSARMKALDVDVGGGIGDLQVEVAFHTADAPLVIAGPNGAGKTNLLMMILGATSPRRGRVALAGVPLFDGE